MTATADGTRAAVLDPVRAYLSQIGRAALLTGAQEADIGRRIEAGLYATELLRAHDEAERRRGGSARNWCATCGSSLGRVSVRRPIWWRPTCAWWSASQSVI
jgi:hypothetical protein